MKPAQLIVLVILFLSALLIHHLMSKKGKEYFVVSGTKDTKKDDKCSDKTPTKKEVPDKTLLDKLATEASYSDIADSISNPYGASQSKDGSSKPPTKPTSPVIEKPTTVQKTISLTVPVVSETADNSIMTKNFLNTNTSIDQIKQIVHDQVQNELKKIRKGPKDLQNAEIESRSLDEPETDARTANSDALEQGSWFRTSSRKSPYANSQDSACQPKPVCSNPICPQSSGSNQEDDSVPAPFNSQDYIRKDSIPCWGCKLN